jgi:hypothetical protein
MKPKALTTWTLKDTKTPEERFTDLGPFARRWGKFPKGTVLPETLKTACRRVKVQDFPADFIPKKYFERLEHDQKLSSCCRHPENHEIEAFKSHPEEQVPDVYILYCTCGRQHRRFCVAKEDKRIAWE